MGPILDNLNIDRLLLLAVVPPAIMVVAIIAAFLFHKVIFPVALRVTNRTPTNLDSSLLMAVRRPITVGIILVGIYAAAALSLELSHAQVHLANFVATVAGLVWLTWLLASLSSQGLDWYAANIAPRTKTELDDRLLPVARRIAAAFIYVLGGLLILDQLSINISPLIAGLGLGGLAVALALQPTLSNLFAGTYVMTEGVVTAGDYIELESGVSGYVIDVGWRSTRLRTWRNNLVVIPNARFAETIITNYQEPEPAVNVFVTCGVSYDSDLRRVREVSQEVMDRLLDTNPHAVKEYGGWFGYESFGDSNVNFWLFVQARDRLASFELQTDLMRDLHRRLGEEGIVINYPVRTLQFPPEVPVEAITNSVRRSPTAAKTGRRQRRPSHRTHPRQDAPGGISPGDGPDGGGPEAPG